LSLDLEKDLLCLLRKSSHLLEVLGIH